MQMTLADLRTAVREMFGDVDSAQFLTVQLNRYINAALEEVVRRGLGTRARTTWATTDAVAIDGVGGVAVPANFLQEIEVRWNTIKLYRLPYDTFFTKGENIQTQTDAPTWYTVTPVDLGTGQRRLLFYPYVTPSFAGTVAMIYVANPATLTTDGEIPGIPDALHMAVVYYACYLTCMSDGDVERANGFRLLFQEQLNNYSMYTMDVAYGESPQRGDDYATTLYAHEC